MQAEELKVIVTGAASGLGRHYALSLCRWGADVAAGDVEVAGLASLAEEAVGAPGLLCTRRLDVRESASCRGFVDWAADAMGGLNALVNNAGILRDGLLVKRERKTGRVLRLSEEDFQAVLDVNLVGATRMAQEVAVRMLETETRPGVIVNLSSIARHGNRGQSSYVAAKAALAANTVTWMRELAPHGIRVGCVAPGMVDTPMTRGMRTQARDALIDRTPVGRIGKPHDMWLAVRFVLECDYFNGRTIDVDGGLSM